MNDMGLAVRSGLRLRPDSSRVITRLFIPGQELVGGSEARTATTVERVLALEEPEVLAELKEINSRFADRHEDIGRVFDAHAERVAAYVSEPLSEARRQLLGAVFTHEFSLEGTS
ncbi:MAG: glycosidase, partial [Acidobacteriota bacterium]|nr:glycosidase [Acidobacteriota bacterium]